MSCGCVDHVGNLRAGHACYLTVGLVVMYLKIGLFVTYLKIGLVVTYLKVGHVSVVVPCEDLMTRMVAVRHPLT